MEVSSRLQSLLRPFLLCRSRAAGMSIQTLALCSPPPPRIPSSFLLRTRRLPPPFPHGGPSRLLFHSTFASVSPAPAPAPGRDHLNSKEQGPPPAPLPPPPPEELASEDESYYHEHLLEVAQENQSRVVPVKAFFLCTRYWLLSVRPPPSLSANLLSLVGDELTSRSIDLRSLQSQNSFNVIPPTSRATNYVVLRYYDVKGDPEVLPASSPWNP